MLGFRASALAIAKRLEFRGDVRGHGPFGQGVRIATIEASSGGVLGAAKRASGCAFKRVKRFEALGTTPEWPKDRSFVAGGASEALSTGKLGHLGQEPGLHQATPAVE